MHSRLTVAALLTAGFLSLALQGADNPKEAVEKTTDAYTLADRLQQRVTIQNEIPDTPLIEVLEFLNDKFGLPVQIDSSFGGGAQAAFMPADARFVRLAGDNPILQERMTIRKMKSVRLETVLKSVCDQIHGTYLIQPDHILLIDNNSLASRVGHSEETPVVLPLVTMKIENRPLAMVLNELSERTNTTILLAPQAADAAKLTISAKLLNTPTDQAIALLAEMGELRSVKKGNAYLVTTAAKAKAMEPAPVVQQALGGMDLMGMGFRRRGNDETIKKIDDLAKKVVDLEKMMTEKK